MRTLTRLNSHRHQLASSFRQGCTAIEFADNKAVADKITDFFIVYSYASSIGDFSSEGEKTFIEYSDEKGTIRLDFLTVSYITIFYAIYVCYKQSFA